MTSGQETQRVYSYNHGAHMGQQQHRQQQSVSGLKRIQYHILLSPYSWLSSIHHSVCSSATTATMASMNFSKSSLMSTEFCRLQPIARLTKKLGLVTKYIGKPIFFTFGVQTAMQFEQHTFRTDHRVSLALYSIEQVVFNFKFRYQFIQTRRTICQYKCVLMGI